MNLTDFGIKLGFIKALVPAGIGGALWEAIGLPLGWLMGAAVVAGAFAISGTDVSVPKPLYAVSLASLGASVGLAITPEVAAEMFVWAPIMVLAAATGITAAAAMAPILARLGGMNTSTAFFSLLPGGIVEMANVGERFGADRTIVAALHAMRVGLVVGLLPLVLFAFVGGPVASVGASSPMTVDHVLISICAGLMGGWLGNRVGLPAAWLLGALIFVGVISSTGHLAGVMPSQLLAAVQVIVGISLGARFQRSKLAGIPRALITGLPVLLVIMAGMALAASIASIFMPFQLPTLVLAFSIGGMAEMVLTSKTLAQNVALVAAFQAVRGVLVNSIAGAVWNRLARFSIFSNNRKG